LTVRRQSLNLVEPAGLKMQACLPRRAGDRLEAVELAPGCGCKAQDEIPVEERTLWAERDVLAGHRDGNSEDLSFAPEVQLTSVERPRRRIARLRGDGNHMRRIGHRMYHDGILAGGCRDERNISAIGRERR